MEKTVTQTLDTLKLSGFSEKQARAIVELIDDKVLTRKDLKLQEQALKIWFAGVALSIAGVLCLIGFALHNGYKTNMAGMEARLEDKIAGVEARLEDKIAGVEARLEARIAGVEVRIAGVETRLQDVKEDIKDLKNSFQRLEEALLKRKL